MFIEPGEALELARIQERWPGKLRVIRTPKHHGRVLEVTTVRGDVYKVVRVNPEVGADDGLREIRTLHGSKKPKWASKPLQEIPF